MVCAGLHSVMEDVGGEVEVSSGGAQIERESEEEIRYACTGLASSWDSGGEGKNIPCAKHRG